MTNHPKTADGQIISPVQAISLALLAYFLFTAGDTMAKWLQSGYHASQIVVTINLIGLVVMMGIATKMRGAKNVLKSKKWKLHALRGATIAVSNLFVFYALKHLPLSDFYGIVFLNPLWVAILSFLFLKEKIPPSRIVAIAVGFMGVLVITGAEFSDFNLGYLAALIVSVLGAAAALLARHIGGDEAPTTFGIATHIALITINLPMVFFHFHMPTVQDAGLMLLYGTMVSIAIMALSTVFSRSHSVSQVAPLQYTQMLWGLIMGWLVFGQTPTERTIAGGILVFLSGLYVMRSLRRGRLMNR